MTKIIIFLLVAAVLLAGCASEAEVQDAPSAMITIYRDGTSFTNSYTASKGYDVEADGGFAFLIIHVNIENFSHDDFDVSPYRFKAEVNNVE